MARPTGDAHQPSKRRSPSLTSAVAVRDDRRRSQVRQGGVVVSTTAAGNESAVGSYPRYEGNVAVDGAGVGDVEVGVGLPRRDLRAAWAVAVAPTLTALGMCRHRWAAASVPPVPCSHPRMAQLGPQLEHPAGCGYPSGTQQATATTSGSKASWVSTQQVGNLCPNSGDPNSVGHNLVGYPTAGWVPTRNPDQR